MTRSYQQEEVPAPQSERVQHDLHHMKCPGCGKEHAAPRPAGVPRPHCRPGRSRVPWPFTWWFISYLVVHQHELLVDVKRGVRPPKTQQKMSGRLTSNDTTQDHPDIRSYLDTAREHGEKAMDVLHNLMLGRP